MRALRQLFLLIAAMKGAAGPSVEQPTANLIYVIKSTNCTYIGYVSPYIINPNAKLNPICHLLALLGAHPILHVSSIRVNYQHVYIAISIIIGVALQEYEEQNNLPH